MLTNEHTNFYLFLQKLLLLLLLLSSVVCTNAVGYDYMTHGSHQNYYYPVPTGLRMSYERGNAGGGGSIKELTSYMTTGNAGQDLKAYASQANANYASAAVGGHLNGVLQPETVAAIAAAATTATAATSASNTVDHSVSINAHNAAKVYAAGNNIYGANSEQFLPAYTSNNGYEDNHLSSASSDYSNAEISALGNEHHSNSYDKFQSSAYSHTIPAPSASAPVPGPGPVPSHIPALIGHYSHGSQTAARTVGGLYDTSAVGNTLVHNYGSNNGGGGGPSINSVQIQQHQPQYIHGKTEPIPVSKHVQITRHIPVPVYKQIHIPYQKPVKVQIPHPVIIPVPQPYPIKIPITKPYAVPLVQELTIPIEKIVPYAVEKKIPFPIEKHVPYPVEKHVTVAIPYHYPVKVPVVKTVLHKVKSHGWN